MMVMRFVLHFKGEQVISDRKAAEVRVRNTWIKAIEMFYLLIFAAMFYSKSNTHKKS